MFMRIPTCYIKIIMTLSLILIVLCLFIIICIGIGFIEELFYINTTEVLTYASVMMATANALLLFATLSYQSRIFNHERFEATLFNLLENHRNIKNDIRLDVFDDYCPEPEKYIGNDIFLFACSELHDIHEVLRKHSNAQVCSYICKMYDLYENTIEEFSMSMKNGQKKAGIVFAIFYNKWRDYYEPIFKSLLLIVSHIANNRDFDLKDRIRYKEYLTAQMSQHELTFMIFLYFYDLDFHKQLDCISENNAFFNEAVESLFRRLIFKHHATPTT